MNTHAPKSEASHPAGGLRRQLEIVIFGTDTPAGRNFDIALLVVILASVLTVMIDSVPHIHQRHGEILWQLEIAFTAVFTLEYLVRIWCTEHRRAYLTSIWGIVDLLAILPTYIALYLPEAAPLVVVRLLRVVRVFRVLKLMALFAELNEILGVLKHSAFNFCVFDHGDDCCSGLRLHYLCRRRPPKRLRQYTHEYLLGRGNDYYRRLRRLGTANTRRSIYCRFWHARGIQHYRRAYRDHYPRTVGANQCATRPATDAQLELPGLRQIWARPRGNVLPTLWFSARRAR